MLHVVKTSMGQVTAHIPCAYVFEAASAVAGTVTRAVATGVTDTIAEGVRALLR